MAIILASGPIEATKAQRPYEPFGAAHKLFYDRSPEVLLAGPAGTGKSRAILEKLHLCAMKYHGMRGLIVRKTRASLTESGLVTFEEKVLPERSPIKAGPQRRYRLNYTYPNNSEIVIAGMDDPNRVMSTEFDIVVCLEATELSETDWENLTTRLRNFVLPYQQLIADCNPASPSHWLKLRADRGVTQLLTSLHQDNPELFDAAKGVWTEKGKAYLRTLGNLTGVRRLRLFQGLWAMAEGMVFADSWRPDLLIDRFAVPRDWRRFWVVDFGFTNPFCWQVWAMDGDGRLFRIAEIYRTKRLVEDHAKDILAWQKETGEPMPEALICDHDAEDRATLERHLGIRTIPASKSVSDGIQITAGRMKVAGDGRARLFLLRDSLVGTWDQPDTTRDTNLAEQKLPTCTEEEVEGYVWNAKKDEPMKRHDHGMDCLRYVVMHVDQGLSDGIFI